MEEYVKISLHNHFGGSKADYKLDSIDLSSLGFSIKDSCDLLDNAELNKFSLIGITNSNYFWCDMYSKMVEHVQYKKYNIQLIPGVEFNLCDKTNTKFLHSVILFDPKCDLKRLETVIKDVMLINKKAYISIAQLVDILCEFKSIFIPHGIKQPKRSVIKNIETFDDISSLRYSIPIMIEDNSESHRKKFEIELNEKLSFDKFEWLEERAYISALDRIPSFDQIKEPCFMWGENSFNSLFYSAIIGKNRFFRENDISTKTSYIKKIVLEDNGGRIKDSTILLSHGMNSIIGNSGSGKTMLLNLIKYHIKGVNLLNAVSNSASDYSEMYEKTNIHFYDNNNEKINMDNRLNIFEGQNLYKLIVSTLKENREGLLKNLGVEINFNNTYEEIRLFNDCLHKYVSDSISVNKIYEKINESLKRLLAARNYVLGNKTNIESKNISYIENNELINQIKILKTELEHISVDCKTIKNNFKSICETAIKYNDTFDIKSILKIRDTILYSIYQKYITFKKDLLVKEYLLKTNSKIFNIVNDYNKELGEKFKIYNTSKNIVDFETEAIINYLKEVYELQSCLKLIPLNQVNLENGILVRSDFVRIVDIVTKTVINYDECDKFFSNVIGASSEKINKSKFKSLDNIDLCNVDSIKKWCQIFIENNMLNSVYFNLIPDSFFKYKIEIADGKEFKNINSLSAGQLSKIYINIMIDKELSKTENDAIILYDQPDNNLEKKFILDILGKKLIELKKKYQVIITTHEPLLVINADSNSIILTESEQFIETKNNKVKYSNISLTNVDSEQDAVEIISELIDGSKEALKIRSQIYDGGKIIEEVHTK